VNISFPETLIPKLLRHHPNENEICPNMSRQIDISVYADSISHWMLLPGEPKEALISILSYLLGLPTPGILRALVIEACNQMP